MKTIHINAKHTKWLTAEDMHDTSKKWLSELEFCKEEQLFFENLIRSFTLQILDNNHFEESKLIIERITEIVKQTETLITAVQSHEKELSIMVDGVDQIEEETAYKKEHRNLIELISEFKNRYISIKSELFNLLKTVMKESKNKHLLNK